MRACGRRQVVRSAGLDGGRRGDAEIGSVRPTSDFGSRHCVPKFLLNRRVSGIWCISWFLSRPGRESKLHQIAPCWAVSFYGTLANKGLSVTNCTLALQPNQAGGFRLLLSRRLSGKIGSMLCRPAAPPGLSDFPLAGHSHIPCPVQRVNVFLGSGGPLPRSNAST